jgi:hypothetical protein
MQDDEATAAAKGPRRPEAYFLLNPRTMTVEEMHQVVLAALRKAGYKPPRKKVADKGRAGTADAR